jgi:DASS family divalent anion:Na+ symporter
MTSFTVDQIERNLCKLSLFGNCSRAAIARAAPYLERRSVKAGETIVRQGDAAKHCYVLMEGQCALQLPGGAMPVDDFIGEEVLMGTAHYHADVVTMSDSELLMLPHEVIELLLKEDPDLPSTACQLMLAKHGHAIEMVSRSQHEPAKAWVEPLGWLLTLALPALIYFFSSDLALSRNSQVFLAILSVTLIMWMFRLVPEYVPGLFVVAATLGLGLAPPNVVLSGFISDSFFLTMSVLGVGAVIVSSGLSYRFLLWLLRFFPQNQLGFNLSIATTGLMLTPVVPSIIGRTALITPLMNDMLQALRLRKGGTAATALAASAFNGLTLLSAVFLTSKAPNLLILAMMPSQIQSQFQMVDWLVAGAVVGIVMLVLYLATAFFFFRNDERPALTREQIQAQLNILGPMQVREWAALGAVLLFAVGVLTYGTHQIPPSWLGMGLICILLAMQFLGTQEFRNRIDWPFLIFFGATIGLINSMNYLGLDKLVTTQLLWIGEYMVKNFGLFLALLIGAMLVVRIVMPIAPATVIFATIFIPLADTAGLNPWVIGFVALAMGELWVLPYQCHYYLQFEEIAGKGSFNSSLMLKHNIVVSLIKIAALYASIPYWKYLHIL